MNNPCADVKGWVPIFFTIGEDGSIRKSAQVKLIDYADLELRYHSLTAEQKSQVFNIAYGGSGCLNKEIE
ncbi:MAG: hypothetical protein QQN63_00750 [Nitrosopumilus sp.]